jgi:hypothetical protein
MLYIIPVIKVGGSWAGNIVFGHDSFSLCKTIKVAWLCSKKIPAFLLHNRIKG